MSNNLELCLDLLWLLDLHHLEHMSSLVVRKMTRHECQLLKVGDWPPDLKIGVNKMVFVHLVWTWNIYDEKFLYFLYFVVEWIFNHSRRSFTIYYFGNLRTANRFLILWCSGNLESGGKGDKNPEHSTTIALQSPFPEYNGRFEIGLGQSMVSLSFHLFYFEINQF